MPSKRRMTREQEKAMWAKLPPRAKAALEMIRQGGTLYHGSQKRLYSLDNSLERSFHIGSQQAALDRLSHCSSKRTRWLHEVMLPKDAKILLAGNKHEAPWYINRSNLVLGDEDANWRVGDYARQMYKRQKWRDYPTMKNKDYAWQQREFKKRLRERLNKRGYDAVAYYNDVEDPGSLSFIVLKPDRVKVKPVGRYKDRELSNYVPPKATKRKVPSNQTKFNW